MEYNDNIESIERIDFISITGETVKTIHHVESGQRIEIGEIPDGLYLVKLNIGNKLSTFKKLIKTD